MGALHQSPRQRRIFSDWPREARHNRGPASGPGPRSSVDVEGLFEQKVRHAVGAYSRPVPMGLGRCGTSYSSSPCRVGLSVQETVPCAVKNGGYSRIRTRTFLGSYGRAMSRSIGPTQGRCVSLFTSNSCRGR